MSVSAVGSTSSISNTYGPQQQRRQDFQQLSKALKAGDLSGAQSAFSALMQDLSAGSAQPSSIAGQLNDPNSPLGQDLAAVGKALQSGDLAGAQQDFAKLQSDVKAQFASQGQAGGVHRHHGHHAKPAGGDSDGDNDGSASSTSTTDPSAGVSGLTGSSTGSTISVTA